MRSIFIAVVDASRARLFRFERSTDSEGLHEQFTELTDLVNPARRRRTSELFSDTRPGSMRSGPLHYKYDDHRENHLDQMDAEFARAIAEEIEKYSVDADRIVLCASHRMLGAMRAATVDLRRRHVELEELARDLVKLTPPQLREHLASYRLLPPVPARRGVA